MLDVYAAVTKASPHEGRPPVLWQCGPQIALSLRLATTCRCLSLPPVTTPNFSAMSSAPKGTTDVGGTTARNMPTTVNWSVDNPCSYLAQLSMKCSMEHPASKNSACAQQFADYKECLAEERHRKIRQQQRAAARANR